MTDSVARPTAIPAESAVPQEPTKARVLTVDIIRGFALFGILFINVTTFRSDNPGWTGLDRIADTLSLILGQGKFLTTFMIMFGVSFTFQSRNIDTRHFLPQYLRRIGMLLVFGLLHFVLVWEGDILLQYVVPGLLLLFFARRGARTVLIWTCVLWGLWLVMLVVIVGVTTFQHTHQGTASSGALFSPTLYGTASYGDLVLSRFRALPGMLEEHGISSVFLLSTFLLGVYIGKSGFLTNPEQHALLLRRVFVLGLPLGLAMNAISSWGTPVMYSMPVPIAMLIIASAVIGLPTLSLAYIAGLALLVQHAPWLKPLAAVGRMSLTNYLMQSVILTTAFYGYGLGWYNKVGPVLGIALITVVFALQIPVSVWWMRRFRYGPMEWIWRSVTYWRVQTLRAPVSSQ